MKGSRSGLLLLELIVTIAFFAFCSATCIQLLVKAHIISRESADLGAAVTAAQSAAEAFKAVEANPVELAELLQGSTVNDMILIQYDMLWNPVSEATLASYTMQVTLHQEHALSVASILVSDRNGVELYSLHTKKYTA